MSSPILPSGFIKTAYKLAGRDAGQGRPALSDLRRSTSTAYYALYHQILRHGVFAAVPNASEDDVANITRWFTHTGVADAAAWVVTAASNKQQLNKSERGSVLLLRRDPRQPIQDELLLVAETFIDLQRARHEADYSSSYDPVRYATVDHVNSAQAALKATESMWRAQESSRTERQELANSYKRFLILCLSASGGPKTR